jgi:uncharacterized protein YkwD
MMDRRSLLTGALTLPLLGAGGREAVAAPSAASRAAALVSAYRAAYGLRPVTADARLSAAAQYQANAVARVGWLSHDLGTTLQGRIAAAGGRRGLAAENLAGGVATLEGAFALWQSSSGHSSNMLQPAMARVGVGQAGGFWALVLSS